MNPRACWRLQDCAPAVPRQGSATCVEDWLIYCWARNWRDILGLLSTRAGELGVEYVRKRREDLPSGDLLERAFMEVHDNE